MTKKLKISNAIFFFRKKKNENLKYKRIEEKNTINQKKISPIQQIIYDSVPKAFI